MGTKRILVVDDEEMIVNLCLRTLKKEGYEVMGASNGEEAVRHVSSNTFDMVVTDLLMPGMDGLETFLALREKQPGIIGVMITAHGKVDTAIEAMGRGLSGFIRKPFMPMELVQVVKEAFQRAAISEENARLKTLIPLYELGEKFILSRSKKEILEGLIDTVSRQNGAQRVSVMLYEKKQDCLRIAAAVGMKREIWQKVRIRPGEKIAGRVFQEGSPVILNGGPEDNPQFASLLRSESIVAAIVFPLKGRHGMLGVLNIGKVGKGSSFSQADIEMVSVICRQAVMALENLRTMQEKIEKIRLQTLFQQYVDPEVAKILISHGQNLLEVGEIKVITVLFADIRNFTSLVQRIPLEILRSFLNDFFGLLSEVVYQFKGTLDKFLGDAALAFFGAPMPLVEPEKAAVDSALLMHKMFEKLNEAWTAKAAELSRIGLGIGISSGPVFLGNVGSRRRLDYTVIGTDVNIAQRLASETASGEILITEGVKHGLDHTFAVTQVASRVLKGVEKEIPVFSVGRPLMIPGKQRFYPEGSCTQTRQRRS
ncbi:MAG: adenylate/guanylate cyclase domain-containing protein [Desulfatiglandaceae bacterium]|jgi:adenylate cyclase